MSEPFHRYQEATKLTGKKINCERCKRKIMMCYGYFRCEFEDCNYDICKSCGEKVELEVTNSKIPFTKCPEAHDLVCKLGAFERIVNGRK